MREKIFATLLGVFCSEKRENVTISKDTKWGNLYSKHTSVLARKGEGKKKIRFLLNWTFLKLLLLFWSFESGIIRHNEAQAQWVLKCFYPPVSIYTQTHTFTLNSTHTPMTHTELVISFGLHFKGQKDFSGLWSSKPTRFIYYLYWFKTKTKKTTKNTL